MQTISAGGPPDVIAYAFYRMGFRPRESLVLVGLTAGPAHVDEERPDGGSSAPARCGLVVRVDIPPPGGRRRSLARPMSLLLAQGHGALVALLVSDRPQPALAETVRMAAAEHGLRLVDLIGVDRSSYRSLFCRDEKCCPPGGIPLARVESSRTAAAMVLDGRSVVADEAELVSDIEPEPERQLAASLFTDPPRVDRERRLHLLERCGDLLAAQGGTDPVEVCEADLVDLCQGLDDVVFRDAMVLRLTGADDLAARTAARLMACGRAEEAFATGERGAPDDDLLERGRRVTSALARRAPAGRRVEVLALMAWVAWWQGDGVRSRLLADRALSERPGHRLACLVSAALTAAVPPPWVPSAATATGGGS